MPPPAVTISMRRAPAADLGQHGLLGVVARVFHLQIQLVGDAGGLAGGLGGDVDFAVGLGQIGLHGARRIGVIIAQRDHLGPGQHLLDTPRMVAADHARSDDTNSDGHSHSLT